MKFLENWQIRLGTIAFFSTLSLILGYQFIWENHLVLPEGVRQVAKRARISLPEPKTSIPLPTTPSINTSELIDHLNQRRTDLNQEPFSRNDDLTKVAELLLRTFSNDQFQVEQKDYTETLKSHMETVGYAYKAVANTAVVGPVSTFEVIESWEDSELENSILKGDYSQIGIGISSTTMDDQPAGVVVVVVAEPAPERNLNLSVDEVPAAATPVAPPPPPTISSTDILEALNSYRATHNVPQLIENQDLCTYAEKRAADLQEFGGLDGHQGFMADFDGSGEPVGIRDYSGGSIGENLASQYCINGQTGDSFVAESATALIEWCFDSSTNGHREAQLNSKYTAACARNADHLFVIIFGE